MKNTVGKAMKNVVQFSAVLLAALLFFTFAPFQSPLSNSADHRVEAASYTSFEDVANYIDRYGELPDNYITKSEAYNLGWEPSEGNLAEVAPGKSIGGDIFSNREGSLPEKSGRVWREADIDYVSGYRNAKRIVYSNDGLIYKTTDHYKTFERMR
ncbi:ribonuclease [Priestia filamentosa]|uniref:ribonuclease n=1 Tax=Priestia filamentosa TaxID=1402861 RepID=UPI00031A3319|nr:ribonuclease [Priestia filamentosa]